MKEKEQKRKIMLVLILMAVLSVSVIGTYAFFITQAGLDEQQKLTIKTGTLALIFEDNDEGLSANMELGKSYSKELTIKNTGTEAVTTNMIWNSLVNTYMEESLSYTLEYKTSEDGDWQAVETSHPNIPQIERAADYNLATGLTIPGNTTYYYKVTITFNNLSDINQETDKTAILSAKFRLGEEVVESKSFKTLAHLKLVPKEGNPNFAEPSTIDETADGLYSLADDYGTSYYYRGAVENNYVKFGGFYWRIIRINGDGSVRMIYDGTQAWPNGNGASSFTTSGTDRFTHTGQKWNANYNDAKYVGWMYGPSGTTASTTKAQAQTNTAESDLKKNIVDPWYKTNIADKGLSKYVGDEIFCNDRSTPGKSATGWSSDTGLGYGNNYTGFGAIARTGVWNSDASTVQPKFKCEQKNDAFTVSDTEKGNGALTYPVGLITADEIVAAGSGKYATTNRYYYLYKTSGYWYWSLSPSIMNATGLASVFYVNTSGNLSSYHVANSGAVALVINLSADYAATLSGSGTTTSPYQLPGVQ